jgi:hypothetical protein
MDWGDVPTWLGLAGGIVAFRLGREEYRNAQQWKRSEFLASEIDRFFAQPRVATALLLIDYSEIWLEPDGRRANGETPSASFLTDALMTSALRVHTQFKNDTEVFDPPEMLAREAFDEILTGFERFDHHIKTGLINVADAKMYLGYWVEKFADPRSGWKPPTFYSALARFVKAYQYRGAAHLFKKFRHPLPPVPEPVGASRSVDGSKEVGGAARI